MSEPKIHVTATFAGSDQPLLRVFEANLNPDVVVERSEAAVKAIIPLELLISATSGAVLKKFILDPILDPIAEKFDWKKAVHRHLKPHQPFSLVISLEAESLLIESSTIYDQSITANIWDTINQTLSILQNENLIDKVTKVRFAVSKDNKLIIGCYQSEQPVCLIDIDKSKTVFISEATEIPPSDADLSNEDWLIKEFGRAAQYEQAVIQQNKTDTDSPAK